MKSLTAPSSRLQVFVIFFDEYSVLHYFGECAVAAVKH